MSNRKFNTKCLFAVMAWFKTILQIKPNHKVSKFIRYIISGTCHSNLTLYSLVNWTQLFINHKVHITKCDKNHSNYIIMMMTMTLIITSWPVSWCCQLPSWLVYQLRIVTQLTLNLLPPFFRHLCLTQTSCSTFLRWCKRPVQFHQFVLWNKRTWYIFLT